MTLAPIIIYCSLALIGLTLLLAIWTTVQRVQSQTIAYNTPLEPTSGMAKAQRGHGNASEYAALLVALYLIIGFVHQDRDLGALIVWTMIAVTTGRFLVALGFVTCKTLARPDPLKAIGSLLTYLGASVLIGVTLMRAL